MTEQPPSTENIIISATFTAEPLIDTLNFWQRELQMSTRVVFAPYNQVFQQLLDPQSLLAQNKTGLNVTLVRFEDWVRQTPYLELELDVETKDRLLNPFQRYILPNHLEIAHLNRYETDYLYQEIFVDHCYLKHGISIDDGACVVDVGANIGLFSLFALQQANNVTIYAFEPAPLVFKILEANLQIYGAKTQAYNCGISHSTAEAAFVFYEASSVFSGFQTDEMADGEAIRTVIKNMMPDQMDVPPDLLDGLRADRLKKQILSCQLRSVSDIIRENNIQQIDLLKIDAEKSELAILDGIDLSDWPKIRQVVLEVHDQDGATLEAVTKILQNQGFVLAVEENPLLRGVNFSIVFATRPADMHPPRHRKPTLSTHKAKIQQNVETLIQASQTLAERSTTPHLIGICPANPTITADPELAEFYVKTEQHLEAELSQIAQVRVMPPAEVAQFYPIENYYDVHSDNLGHIPYTPEYYTALGTMIVRKHQALHRTPYKVVVLDCDNTLWGGICGEVGWRGIRLDEAYQKLQQFMLAQHNRGLLLCLCSKNASEDVWAVFEQRDDMILRRKHIVTARINWEPKSQNIRSLATELQLGLDSFIVIDDDPLEIAEIEANCPEVLALQLPTEVETIPAFLEHLWVFDDWQVTQVTDEDQARTDYYRQHLEREHFRKTSLTLADFLAGLKVEIDILAMQPEDIPRISQLTRRTNQFNVTTIRRSIAEIQNLYHAQDHHFLTVHVRDRFGDYGLVGVLVYTLDEQALTVDTFLLSCRVLGRDVENRMLAKLGNVAQNLGLAEVHVPYISTNKNQPALRFLEAVGSAYKFTTDFGFMFKVPAEIATET